MGEYILKGLYQEQLKNYEIEMKKKNRKRKIEKILSTLN